MAIQVRPSTTLFLFLFLFFIEVSLISAAMAASYTPPTPGSWKDVPGARTSSEFINAAKFATAEHNRQDSGSKLVFVKVLEGQVWATRAVGVTTYQFLMEAKAGSRLYKVYRCVVSVVVVPNEPRTLRSFEPVLS